MNQFWVVQAKRIYRVLAVLCLLIAAMALLAVYPFKYIDINQGLLILIISIVILGILAGLTRSYQIYQKQENEIQMYKVYTKPLEELIKEIRARQHEFDNHLNCILNMHIMVDNYDELVKCQSEYIFSVVDNKKDSYLPLLKLSDKILAGFLYTKIVSVTKNIRFDIEVGTKEIITNVPDSELVEVIGTLIDNAVEACNEDNDRIKLFISSENDKLIFEVMNEHKSVSLAELGHFFEKGYSTKLNKGQRGYGLYNARRIIKAYRGDIFVENKIIEDRNYIDFRIEV